MPNTVDLTQIQALVVAQGDISRRFREQAQEQLLTILGSFDGWYDSAQITDLSASLASTAESYQRVLAQSTDAYLGRVFSAVTGSRTRPIGRLDVNDLRQGVTHAGSYARAADAYRYQQSLLDAAGRQIAAGKQIPAPQIVSPLDAARERVSTVMDLDAQLATQGQSRKVMSAAGERGVITGYRRVIHPELSKGGSCGLCVAASDRLYKAREPMPIHANCECTTVPVFDFADPGSELNARDLKQLYEVAGSTKREHLSRVRYQVDEHGELGPVLNPAGAEFRTAKEAADAVTTTSRPASADVRTERLTRLRDDLQQAVAPVTDLANVDPAWAAYREQLTARVDDLTRQLAARRTTHGPSGPPTRQGEPPQ